MSTSKISQKRKKNESAALVKHITLGLLKWFMQRLKAVDYADEHQRVVIKDRYAYASDGHFACRMQLAEESLSDEGVVITAEMVANLSSLARQPLNMTGGNPFPTIAAFPALPAEVEKRSKPRFQMVLDTQRGIDAIDKQRAPRLERCLTYHLHPRYLKLAAELALKYGWDSMCIEFDPEETQDQPVYFRRVAGYEVLRSADAEGVLPDVFILMPMRK
jgi:hypothetical protein